MTSSYYPISNVILKYCTVLIKFRIMDFKIIRILSLEIRNRQLEVKTLHSNFKMKEIQ